MRLVANNHVAASERILTRSVRQRIEAYQADVSHTSTMGTGAEEG